MKILKESPTMSLRHSQHSVSHQNKQTFQTRLIVDQTADIRIDFKIRSFYTPKVKVEENTLFCNKK